MRTPEFQLIDKLEELKSKIKKSAPVTGISIIEYKENLFSALNTKLSEVDSTDADNTKKAVYFIKDALTLTLALANTLIAQTNSAVTGAVTPEADSSDSDIDNGEGLETLVHSLCSAHPQKEEIAEMVMATFVGILKDYRETIEKTCALYNLDMPIDNTRVIADLSDGFADLDGKITLFRLAEMRYMLDKMLNATIAELQELHPIRSLPYMRHMQLTDAVVDQMQVSKQELTERLSHRIKKAQDTLRSIIADKSYPDTTETVGDIITRQTQLLSEIGAGVAALGTLQSQLQAAMRSERTLDTITIVRSFQVSTQTTKQKIEQFSALETTRMRIGFQFDGTDVEAMTLSAASSGRSTQDLGICSREESRFGVMRKIIREMTADMNQYQSLAGESTSDYGLERDIRKLNDEIQPFSQMMSSMRNSAALHGHSQAFIAGVEAFSACLAGREIAAAPTRRQNEGCAQQ
ncbi:MAG: hypothetical protein NTZ67_01110 [Gammaproteobacteria bacterium]|nr:hypothetical protein [Gammaproteobacteria bacterium]